jgi:NADH-quinone oxidoreductase subunit J
MVLTQIVFMVFAAVTLLGGLFCVTTRNMFHAALYLVISLFGAASMFAMLEASFLAAAQLIVYVGAVAILIIFAVMLTRGGAGSLPARRQFNTQAGLAAVVTVVTLFILLRVVPFFNYPVQKAVVAPEQTLVNLGQALVGDFVLPFEVASVLLLVALIGAIYIARERRKGEAEED